MHKEFEGIGRKCKAAHGAGMNLRGWLVRERLGGHEITMKTVRIRIE